MTGRRRRRPLRRPTLSYTDKVHLQRWVEGFDYKFALAVIVLVGAVFGAVFAID